MKTLPCIFLLCLLIAGNGCMTVNTVEFARGSSHTNEKGVVIVDDPPKPGYYALLPLTVAGDIATSPIQLILALLMKMSGIQC